MKNKGDKEENMGDKDEKMREGGRTSEKMREDAGRWQNGVDDGILVKRRREMNGLE